MKLTTEKIKFLIQEELKTFLFEIIKKYDYKNENPMTYKKTKIHYYVFLRKPKESQKEFMQRCEDLVGGPTSKEFSTASNPVGHYLVKKGTPLFKSIEKADSANASKYPQLSVNKGPVYTGDYYYAVGVDNTSSLAAIKSDVKNLI